MFSFSKKVKKLIKFIANSKKLDWLGIETFKVTNICSSKSVFRPSAEYLSP